MRLRKYGITGKQVCEVGFGAWQLGNGRDWAETTSEADAITLVHKAIDEGCNFFDTAPGYGNGHSETILGKALVGRRQQVVLNTKTGHLANGSTDFAPAAIRMSVEESLVRLRTDYIDSVILHNPPSECLSGDSPQMHELSLLYKEGKILAFGASVDSAADMRTVLDTSAQEGLVLEVLFNIFHQDTRRAFAIAAEKQAAIIVKVPLDSGWLSGKYGRDTSFSDIRSRWSPNIISRRFDLLEKVRFLESGDRTLAQAALQFVLAHPEVTTVIPGVKNEEQLRQNLSASAGRLSDEEVDALHELWETELANNPLPW